MNNRLNILFLLIVVALFSCNKSGQDTVSEPVDDESNQTLYDQVMDIHDEVMPKMDDLYSMKKDLQGKLADSANLDADRKMQMELTIAQLDSASNSMMVWMRQFNPPADSTGEEAVREYLESQLEMVKKMREEVLEALERGKKEGQ